MILLASAALTTQSPTSRLPSTPAPVVDYDGGRRVAHVDVLLRDADDRTTMSALQSTTALSVQMVAGFPSAAFATVIKTYGLPWNFPGWIGSGSPGCDDKNFDGDLSKCDM